MTLHEMARDAETTEDKFCIMALDIAKRLPEYEGATEEERKKLAEQALEFLLDTAQKGEL